jgi:predicted N-acetyltransferase YhbS
MRGLGDLGCHGLLATREATSPEHRTTCKQAVAPKETATMDIAGIIERDLTEAQQQEIQQLQYAAFPDTDEFATQRCWHTPLEGNELWLNARKDGVLIGSVLLMFRTVTSPAGDLFVGAIGNVCSHPDHRGAGAASACMTAAAEAIQRECDFGVLFCGPPVREFYAKLGWTQIGNPMRYQLIGDSESQLANERHGYAMAIGGKRPVDEWPRGEINLNGPDW